jgi:hypothetical protein
MKHEPLSSIIQGGGKRRMGIGYAGLKLPGNALAWSTNWPPGAQALVVTIEAFTPNS